jgi:lipopolysaccharide export system permease protein
MVSIIYFIKIAQITAIIKVTFLELGELYLFILPRIIIYTFPMVFFIAIALTLTKMSKDNEISVIFSFGVSPKKIVKLFFVLSFTVSLFLLVNAIFLVPISKQLYKNFVDVKKAEAKLNITAMEFGQKFSNWLVFINKSKKQNSFQDIIMYSKEKNKEDFIIAKDASIKNSKGILNLHLQNGKAFVIEKDAIKQTDYKAMNIYNSKNLEISGSKGVLSYWLKGLEDKGRAKDFATFILISVFPLFAFLLSISIGIFNPRYERSNAYIYIFVTIFTYYVVMYYLISLSPLLSLVLVPFITLLSSVLLFKRKILKRY